MIIYNASEVKLAVGLPLLGNKGYIISNEPPQVSGLYCFPLVCEGLTGVGMTLMLLPAD